MASIITFPMASSAVTPTSYDFSSTSSTPWTAKNTNGSTSKSAYTQLIASTTRATTWIYGVAVCTNGDSVNESGIIFIATGGAGSESDKAYIPIIVQSTSYNTVIPFAFQLSIAISTRIAWALQYEDNRAAQSARLWLGLGQP